MAPAPVLTFERSGLGRTRAVLNEAAVGEIVQSLAPRRFRFSWICRLDQLDGQPQSPAGYWRPANTFEGAVRGVEEHVNEWLCRAGLLLPGQGVRCVMPEKEEAS